MCYGQPESIATAFARSRFISAKKRLKYIFQMRCFNTRPTVANFDDVGARGVGGRPGGRRMHRVTCRHGHPSTLHLWWARRPLAACRAVLFAQLVVARGVIVLNDPTHLTDASNKTYFQHFPEDVRPVTCISRDPGEIKDFIAAQGGRGVIKPLQGSGGQGVFVVNGDGGANVNQMIEAVTRDGYAIAQEYLPKAAEGDLRLLTLNGRPLQVDGRYACFRRYNDSGDARSNISAGGKIELAEPDADALRLAELVAPKLIRDGMYLAGLDIVGDKLMEVNVDTPGGINMAEELTGVDFSAHIIDDLARKVRLRNEYRGNLTNVELAML